MKNAVSVIKAISCSGSVAAESSNSWVQQASPSPRGHSPSQSPSQAGKLVWNQQVKESESIWTRFHWNRVHWTMSTAQTNSQSPAGQSPTNLQSLNPDWQPGLKNPTIEYSWHVPALFENL